MVEGKGRQSRASRAVQTRWPQLSWWRKVAGGRCPFRRAGVVRGWGRVGRARTCACCRLEFTTLPYSSSEYSNSESPISTAVMERASVCPRDGELFFRWIARHNARSRNAQSWLISDTPSPQPGGGVEPRGSCSRHPGGRTPRMRTVGSVGPGPRAPRRRVQKTPASRTTEESHHQIHENGTRRR